MSTTEDHPAWINTTGRFSLGHGTNVWTDGGVTNGVARLGDVTIQFRSPQQVRDLIGYLAGLAGEMDAEIAKQQPGCVCDRDGVGAYCPVHNNSTATAVPLGVILPEPEQPPCPRCGSTTAPKRDGSDECWNRGQCTDRAEIARQRQPADEPDPAVRCSRCGAANVPTVEDDDGKPECWNVRECNRRMARALDGGAR